MPVSRIDEFYDTVDGKADHLCVVKFCRKNRCGSGHRLCNGHRMAKWRADHPVTSAYQNLRDSARRRNIPFNLTVDEFREFVKDNGYIENKGTTAEALQCDRKDATKGYEAGNLQVLTTTENTIKGNKERWKEDYRRMILERKGYIEPTVTFEEFDRATTLTEDDLKNVSNTPISEDDDPF